MYNTTNTNRNTNVCVLSSTLFLLNAGLCWYLGFHTYSALFLILTATSILFHTHRTNRMYEILDKVAVATVILYGGYVFFTNWNKYTKYSNMIIIASFLSTLVLFTGGYLFSVLCYDPKWGNVWHSILHLISIIGHSMVVVLV